MSSDNHRNAVSDTKDKIILGGDEALELWRKGKNAWNRWVEENSVADVSFGKVDFSKERTAEMPDIDFQGFNFPKGNVYFTKAIFTEGRTLFNLATFGKGHYNFEREIFKGHADFSVIKNIHLVKSLSFKSASFEKTFD